MTPDIQADLDTLVDEWFAPTERAMVDFREELKRNILPLEEPYRSEMLQIAIKTIESLRREFKSACYHNMGKEIMRMLLEKNERFIGDLNVNDDFKIGMKTYISDKFLNDLDEIYDQVANRM